MGCRVIFSCLKELARRLDVPGVPAESCKTNTVAGTAEGEEEVDEEADLHGPRGDDDGDEGEAQESEAYLAQAPADPSADAKQDSTAAPEAAPRRASTGGRLLSGASSLGRGMYSLGGKIVTPIANTVTGGGRKEEFEGPQLLPRELKGLIGDVVLLGAPLNPKVRLCFVVIVALYMACFDI